MKKLNTIGDWMLGKALGTTEAAAINCIGPDYYDHTCIDGRKYRRKCYYDYCERQAHCGPYRYTGNFC